MGPSLSKTRLHTIYISPSCSLAKRSTCNTPIVLLSIYHRSNWPYLNIVKVKIKKSYENKVYQYDILKSFTLIHIKIKFKLSCPVLLSIWDTIPLEKIFYTPMNRSMYFSKPNLYSICIYICKAHMQHTIKLQLSLNKQIIMTLVPLSISAHQHSCRGFHAFFIRWFTSKGGAPIKCTPPFGSILVRRVLRALAWRKIGLIGKEIDLWLLSI